MAVLIFPVPTSTTLNGGESRVLSADDTSTFPSDDVEVWSWHANIGSLANIHDNQATWTAPDATPVEQSATITASVEHSSSPNVTTLGTIGFTVRAEPSTPSLPNILDQTATVGTSFSITLPASSLGNPPLTYSVTGLGNGLSFNSNNRQISGTPNSEGTLNITYTATDVDNESDSSSFDINIASMSEPDVEPVLPSISRYNVVGGGFTTILPGIVSGTTPITYSVSESDLNGQIDSFSASTREITVSANNIPSTFTITYTATNDAGSDSVDVDFRFTSTPPVDTAPVLSITIGYSSENQSQTVTLPAATSGTTPITYSVSENDADGSITSFNADTRQIVVRIPNAPANFQITYTATNDVGSDSETVQFARTAPDVSSPSFPTNVGPYSRVGAGDISVTLPIASGGASPLVYSADESDPDGSISSFDASTRAIIVNIPTPPATVTVTYTVTDADSRQDEAMVDFNATVVFMSPVLPTSIGPYSSENQSQTVTLPAATSGTTPITYSVSENDADGSITSFDASTRIIVVSIPNVPATLTVVYRAENSVGATSNMVQFLREVAPMVSTLTLPNVSNISRTLGGPVYSNALPAASGGTSPYTYSVSGRPSFLGFNSSTRRFTGIESQTGTWNLIYRVRDSSSPQQSASRSFSYRVSSPAPTIIPRIRVGANGSFMNGNPSLGVGGVWRDATFWVAKDGSWQRAEF